MKRFVVFSSWDHESGGGAHDIVGDYDSIEEAIRANAPIPSDHWGHVLDTHTGEVTEIPGHPSEPCSTSSEIAIVGVPSAYRGESLPSPNGRVFTAPYLGAPEEEREYMPGGIPGTFVDIRFGK